MIAESTFLGLGMRVDDILGIIDAALARKGLSASAASRLAVGNPSLIKNMRSGSDSSKRFNTESLRKLAHVLDLELYFGEARAQNVLQMPGGFAERTVEPLSGISARREALEMGFLPIPYHSIAAPDFRGTAPVALARGWLDASGIEPDGLAFLPVTSDDMLPTLTIGTLALIDTAQTEAGLSGPAAVRDGAIWALAIKGRYGFARVQRPSPDMMVIKGDKPDQPVQIFTGSELAAVKILGKVVWIVHKP